MQSAFARRCRACGACAAQAPHAAFAAARHSARAAAASAPRAAAAAPPAAAHTCSSGPGSRARRRRPRAVSRAAAGGGPGPAPSPAGAAGPAAAAGDGASGAEEARYRVLLAILLKLSEGSGSDARFRAFVAAQPSATAVPFLTWLARLEARAASPEERAALCALCERLVIAREQSEADALDELYEASLRLVAGGDEREAALVRADPADYALRLAGAVTGGPVVTRGYGAAYDALLAAAPPAALTPEGVAKAHKEAAELADDMRARRRRSFAAVVGRMRIDSPEAEAALLAPSAASRILDLLLSLGSEAERAALLPDCFLPPPAADAQPGGGSGGSGVVEGAETDELWCTPLQLLTEVEARARAAAAPPEASARDGGGGGGEGAPQQQRMLGGGHGLVGEAYVAALAHLRGVVTERWLASLPKGGGDGV
ncbi:hypothetical protein Rsub_08855 [Raphidocelis subcapitata]|uniref:Uncharacterized protein n=1 Tax=Raphidocelis subcapitata TaxID=307507 RepID=A0A2V0PDS0_9CHLO|nr:hypothetical protein Rsub_08855 [Raphidocelis subcapitata]|eukprot:GBF96040.1 hypothetical protein Rsub_08855 [Raphidocelis subcapitata]